MVVNVVVVVVDDDDDVAIVVVVGFAVVDDVSVAAGAEITVAPLMQFRTIACLLSRFPIRENFV